MRTLVRLFALTICIAQAQPAAAQDALKFFKNYFVTGDYVVAGVGLQGRGVNGLANGTIALPANSVPANADILAAYLYWQVVTKSGSGSDGGAAATFQGQSLTSAAGPFAKVLNTAGTASCWSSGGATGSGSNARLTYTYRADVLRFLPVDPMTGKYVFTQPLSVGIPDAGSNGNASPSALGASLVVVYRDPSLPLNAIVIYDGGYTMDQNHQSMSQSIRGFYEAATSAAKITHIVGSAQSNKSERLLLPGLQPIYNPFTSALGPSWDSPTYNVSLSSTTEPAMTSVDHLGLGTFDCLTWGAIVLRTAVKDSDGDGLLDTWETNGALTDPNGQPLPNLAAMGANPLHKDLFVEVGYMKTDGPTSYGGSPAKPAHTHRPTPAALKLVGDAFVNAPVTNPDSLPGINVHFDVGNDYPAGADPYVIRSGLARGGETINEGDTVCTPGAGDPAYVCQFSTFPGTVGWKTGFHFLRDQLISPNAPMLMPDGTDPCDAPGNDGPGGICERRFDRNRKDMFHYVLFAHALGMPKAPCLLPDGSSDTACENTNPDFHVPVTNSGIGDLAGGDLMVSLGAFKDAQGKPVGSDFIQGSTLMHELGHNFERRHGGDPGEANCKPNYLSTMNYNFQLRGLLDNANGPHMDFSDQVLGTLNETSLGDPTVLATVGAFAWPKYRTGWYAPQSAKATGKVAPNHCDGTPLLLDAGGNPTEPATVHVDQKTIGDPIYWNMDAASVVSMQDINFDGTFNSLTVPPVPLHGSNDWANLHLNQIGGRRNIGGEYEIESTPPCPDVAPCLGVGPMSLGTNPGDTGRGDISRGDTGRGDTGRGDTGRGDTGRGDTGRGDTGRGDTGRGDTGRGDTGVGAPGENGDLTFELAVTLDAPPVANNDGYTAYRDVPLVVPAATGVLANDSDPDSPTFTAVLLEGAEPLHGTLSCPTNVSLPLCPDGSFTYTPSAGYVGPDSFQYTANDVSLPSNVATASITVIQKIASTVTVTCPVAPLVYTGLAQTPCTAVATAVDMSPIDVTASIIYTNNKNAGLATANASWAGDATHFGSNGQGNFTIAPATLTVKANNANRYYGVANPAFTVTYSGFVNGETTAVLSGLPALSTAATPTSAPGPYPIVVAQGTLAAANYTFMFVNGTLTVLPDTTAPTVTYSLSPSYVASVGQGVKKPVTVSGNITDTQSGLATATFSITDQYNRAGSIAPVSGNITVAANGAYSFAVQLEAWRKSTDLERDYWFTIVATDKAGNVKKVTFEIDVK
jgi:hypothetical protein